MQFMFCITISKIVHLLIFEKKQRRPENTDITDHTDPEEGIGQTECPGKTASGPRSPATIGKRQ